MNGSWRLATVLAALSCHSITIAADKPARDAGSAAPNPSAPAAGADRLSQVIDEVRKAEERYRNLEAILFLSREDEPKPAAEKGLNVSKEAERLHVVEQGELFWFSRRQVQTLVSGESIVNELLSVFDGETTRCVVSGNCVNLFEGRHEPSQLYPPHCWGMQLLQANMPLSVYLQGTEAIKKHPKAFQSPVQGGRVFEIAKVETELLSDEVVDGLKCVKLRSRRWSRDNDAPMMAEIWLAAERNYLCAKAAASFELPGRTRPYSQTQVQKWTEIAPGLWLPKKIETVYYRPFDNAAQEAQVSRRETLVVEKANATRNYPNDHFRDVSLPEGLPVYRIDREGYLEGSGVKSAKTPPGDPHELDRILQELRRQERRYERLDVSLETEYRTFAAEHIGMPGLVLSSRETERSVSLRDKLYSERRKNWHTAGMGDSSSQEQGGWDGQWTRTLHWQADRQGDFPANPTYANLRKGGPKGLAAFRPHTALFDDWRLRDRPLSEWLTAEYWDETNKYRYLVEFIGEETVRDLACVKLRLGFLHGDQKEPSNSFHFLWLAKDRNYLPVRSEFCDLSRSDRLPTGVAYVEELRELKPGLWFPAHAVEIGHDNWGRDGLGSGQIVIHWRRDRRVKNVSLDPDVEEALFAPAAPAGAVIYTIDASGRQIGQFRQREAGPARISEQKWEVMAVTSHADALQRKERQAALDTMVGQPLPEFQRGTWLNSQPLSNETLAGKVVLIDCWAEWCGPCRGELEQLGKIDRELAADGVTVIGVHTAGSEKQEIADLAKQLGLDYPIYIDGPVEGKAAWGRLFEQLAVRELPHTFVVDRQGKIAAHGRLDQMVFRARALAAQK